MTTKRSFLSIDRYYFDFKQCKYSDGWAQLDTDQDAWYFGNWVNLRTLQFVSYAEGDIIEKQCSNLEEFKKELKETFKWYRKNGYNPRIDIYEMTKEYRDAGYRVSKYGLVKFV